MLSLVWTVASQTQESRLSIKVPAAIKLVSCLLVCSVHTTWSARHVSHRLYLTTTLREDVTQIS